jgi:hypothetical protein
MSHASRSALPFLRRLAWLALPALAVASVLEACLKDEELTRTVAPASVAGPDCASCHAYPPKDTNHSYHLFEGLSIKRINGQVTCLDCHHTALAGRTVRLADSIYVDSLDNQWSSLDFPDDPGIRKFRLDRVDTVVQDHPLKAAARPGVQPLFQEYITSLAHMNGKVDVAFHPRVTDTTLFPGLRAEFMPEKETCSAMACHPTVVTPYWRFADSARGLRELTGEAGDIP